MIINDAEQLKFPRSALQDLADPARKVWRNQPNPVALTEQQSAAQQRTGYLARLVREPAWLMSRAPTTSPMSALRLGATLCMRSSRYVCSLRTRCQLLLADVRQRSGAQVGRHNVHVLQQVDVQPAG